MADLLRWLNQLFIEQTSPMEMIIFIFVVVVVCLSLAAFLYAAIISAVWAGWLRAKGVGLRKVLLPSSRQFGEYTAEYVLAISTSVLLAVTTVVKHGLIEQIKSWPAEDLPGLTNLFPLHTVPDAVQNLTGEIAVSSLLKPALDAGQAGPVRVVIEGLIEQELVRPSGRWLPIACGVMIVAHLAWLVSRRYTVLSKSPEDESAPRYSKTSRSLLVLAVCVALLLAAPRMISDSSGLAASSVASLHAVQQESVPHYDEIYRAIDEQRQDLRILQGARNQVLDPELGAQGSVWSAIADRLDGHDQSVSRLYTRMDSASAGISGLESRLADVESSLAGLLDRLDTLDQSVSGLSDRVGAAEAEIGEIDTRIVDLGGRLDGLEGQARSHERLINGLLTSFTSIEARLETVARRLSEIDARFAPLVELIDGIREQVNGLIERVARLEGLHGDSGLLIVSGRPGMRFTIRETGRTAEVPAVLELDPGVYTLVVLPPERTAVATLAQPPAFELQVIVEVDKATGVTIPPIGGGG